MASKNGTSILITSLLLQLVAPLAFTPSAIALAPMPVPTPIHPIVRVPHHAVAPTHSHRNFSGSVKIKTANSGKSKKKAAKKPAPPPKPPQDFVGQMSSRTIAPGVVHKVHRGAMFINLLDVDLAHAGVQVKPVLAGEKFNTLDEVKDQASKVNAIAAINGNYFKRDGTPLGTLIIDGEWIAGPLFDRTCMGVTRDGRILVDRVKLHGVLETSNPDAANIWVNNINQPRRHGCHLIAYTRRWGDAVNMAYDGSLVAVDASGRVIDKSARNIAIPYGGWVFSDSKDSQLARLNVGDQVNLTWKVSPGEWANVTDAVSGGPVLVRDGKVFVDVQNENFRKSWTSNSIHARTAVGVTANRHLLLATIEGPHTLYDVAKFFVKLGAVDAMNLDGGGSTTMVIGGQTVTKNQNAFQRRVASSLAVLPHGSAFASGSAPMIYRGAASNLQPTANITDFGAQLPRPTAPTNLNSFEVVNTQGNTLAMPCIIPANNNTVTMQPVADAKLEKKKGRFGWFHKLAPLR